MTNVLLCWLALMPQVSGVLIQRLAAGTHIEKVGPALTKAFDLEFTINTSVNVSSDLSKITNQVSEFQNYCNSPDVRNLSEISLHCAHFANTVQKEAVSVTKTIQAIYSPPRKARSVLAVLGGVATKAAGKWGPHILTAIGLAYHENKINTLNENVMNLHENLLLHSRISANISEI